MRNLRFLRSKSISTLIEKGRGGRSSDSGVTVTVFGGSGWIGRNVMCRLGRDGYQAVMPHRRSDTHIIHYKPMADLGQFNFVEFWDIRNREATRRCIQHSDVVVNLLSRDYHTSNYNMQEVLVDFPVNLAEMCKEEGVERFIHVSAYAADKGAKCESLQLKALAENRIRNALPETVIIRPAKTYGWDDKYFKLVACYPSFAGLRFVGKNFFGGPDPIVKMPVSLADVSQAIVNACKIPNINGNTYELLGPESYEMRDLACYVMRLVNNIPGGPEEIEIALKEVPVEIMKYYARLMCKLSWKFAPRWTEDRIEMIYTSERPRGLPGLAELGITDAMTIEHGALDVVRHMREWDYFHQPTDETYLPPPYREKRPDFSAPL